VRGRTKPRVFSVKKNQKKKRNTRSPLAQATRGLRDRTFGRGQVVCKGRGGHVTPGRNTSSPVRDSRSGEKEGMDQRIIAIT